MKIGNRPIGHGEPTFIIAELCSNVIRHLSDLEGVLRSVASTGAMAAKIQLFKSSHFPESERSSKKLVEFPRSRVKEFIDLCHENNLLAGASAFDGDAIALLEKHGADYIKIATREDDNVDLWIRVLESSLPKIASFDCTKTVVFPFAANTIYLACIPQYPTIIPRVPDYGYVREWGWSSHYICKDRCLDVLIAVSRGANVVERHIAFSETDFEAGWSSDVGEFRQMVQDIGKMERMR